MTDNPISRALEQLIELGIEPKPKRDGESEWRAIADQVGRYRRDHGRWPRMRSDAASERRLGQWLNAQRVQARGHQNAHRLGAGRRKYLDAAAPGWLLDSEAKWRASADAVGQFYAVHRRWPEQRADDPHERRLGKWLSDHRTSARGGPKAHLFTPERRKHMDVAAPGWSYERDCEAEHRDQAVLVGEHYRRHGRWPRTTAEGQAERRLGAWLSRQRGQGRGGKTSRLLTTSRRAALDEVAPGWLSS